MKQLVLIVALTTVACLQPLAARAEVPTRISVGGQLTDTAGIAVPAGVMDFTFKIFDAEAGGTELWPAGPGDTHTLQVESDGTWATDIGTTTPIDDTVFDAIVRWLEITIDDGINPPETLSRIRLNTNPFAFRVGTLDGATGGTVTGDLFVSGKATIGPGHSNNGSNAFVAGADNIAGAAASTIGGGSFNRVWGPYAVVAGGGGSTPADSNSARAIQSAIGGGRRNLVTSGGQIGTIAGGFGNTVSAPFATVSGGEANIASATSATVGGGNLNVAGGNSATVSGGQQNAAGNNYTTVSGGRQNQATSQSATVGGGRSNVSSGDYATIAGGQFGTADGLSATIGGGQGNVASDDYSTTGGGWTNEATAPLATIAGGWGNDAADTAATVGGGRNNVASGIYSTVSGGGGPSLADSNSASGGWSAVSGGKSNTASGEYASVGGGRGNVATEIFTTVAGGVNNAAGNWYSAVGGGASCSASAVYSAVAGGLRNFASDTAAAVGGGSYNRARGMYSLVAGGGGRSAVDSNSAIGDWSAIGGGMQNVAGGEKSTVSGGSQNSAGAFHATVGGGFQNDASQSHATIGGGTNNGASGLYSTVSGGSGNTASDLYATVAGGGSNEASGQTSCVGGGIGNIASGGQSAVPGGMSNSAAGDNSFAAGFNAKANHGGSIVIAANLGTGPDSVRSGGSEQMVLRADGGLYITNTSELAPYDNTNLITTRGGAYLSGNGTDWTNSSDRDLKEHFRDVDGAELLNKVAALKISRWNYRCDDPELDHIGPTAQDFYEQFGLGGDDRAISTIDPAGVALVAIQELHRRTDELNAKVRQIDQLQVEIMELRALLERVLSKQARGAPDQHHTSYSMTGDEANALPHQMER